MMYFEMRDNPLYKKQHPIGSLKIIDSGYISAPYGWRHKKQFLEHCELIYVTEGVLYLNISGNETTITCGDLIILKPYFTLQGSKASEETVSFYWATFSTDQLDIINPLTKVKSVTGNSQLNMLLDLLCDTFRHPEQQKLQESLLLSMLNFEDIHSQPELHHSKIEKKVQNYLDTHLSEPLTAGKIADALHYHQDYLCRALFKETGVTLKAYINRKKMDAACMLLRTSSYSINEIGNMVGYEDSNLFTKFFEYHMGTTPSSYRNGGF